MTDPRELLRKTIEQDVYITKDKELFLADSPWLMDFRRVFMRAEILDAYAEAFYERFKNESEFQVGGMEVSAIPLVTAVLLKMREKGRPVNGFFVRKSRKKEGLLKMVEGKITDVPVILVDDLINNGYTFEKQVATVEEAGQKVRAVFVTLRFRPTEDYPTLLKKNIRIESLFTLDDFHKSLGISNKLRINDRLAPVVFRAPWRFQAKDPHLEAVRPKSGVAIDRENVYFGSDRGALFALRKSDGGVVWEHHLSTKPKLRGGQIFGTPVLYDGRLYFGAHDGNVYCLDAKTGKQLWVSFDADWIEGAVLVLPGLHLLIVPTVFGLWRKEGGVVALDLTTGKSKWEKRTKASIIATPIFSKRHHLILVGTTDGTLLALDPKSGKLRWGTKTTGAIQSAVALDSSEERVLMTTADGCIYCLDATDGSTRWCFENGLANYSDPIVEDGRVYFSSLDKHVYGLDLDTGKELWNFRARARIFASPRMYEGKLYVGANDARLYELNPETGKETGYFQVVERITNPLVYDPETKHFFLTTYANEVFCLERIHDPSSR